MPADYGKWRRIGGNTIERSLAARLPEALAAPMVDPDFPARFEFKFDSNFGISEIYIDKNDAASTMLENFDSADKRSFHVGGVFSAS